jgi:hypothetical protein
VNSPQLDSRARRPERVRVLNVEDGRKLQDRVQHGAQRRLKCANEVRVLIAASPVAAFSGVRRHSRRFRTRSRASRVDCANASSALHAFRSAAARPPLSYSQRSCGAATPLPQSTARTSFAHSTDLPRRESHQRKYAGCPSLTATNVPLHVAVTLPFASRVASITARSSFDSTTCERRWSVASIGVGRLSVT